MGQALSRSRTRHHAERGNGGTNRNILLIAMCLAVLLAQVDTSVVNLAVHSIRVDLAASVTGLQWVLDAYNLAYALLLLTGGLLADLYGRRRLFVLGAAIFTAGSLLCAAATVIAVLIAGRAIAGVGAALLLPASLSIIRVEWREERDRNRALGIWAACNGLAFVIGPTLGGALVDAFGWRSVFLIAVPLGSVAIGLAWRVVPESRDPQGRRFDALGQASGAAALGALALAGIDASRDGGAAAAALVAGLTALVVFVRTEHRQGAAAIVRLDLFRSPRLVGTLTATGVMTFGMYGVLFLVPLVWQASGTLPAGWAGLALVPMAATFFMLSNASGQVVERVGARIMIGGGTLIIGIGLLVIASTAAGAPLSLAETGLVLTGCGMGLNTGPLFGVAVSSVPPERSGSAASLINVARMIGATLGVAVLGTVFAAAGSPVTGLRAAMAIGGTIQIVGAVVAWIALRPPHPTGTQRPAGWCADAPPGSRLLPGWRR